jgi:hypothetical protein
MAVLGEKPMAIDSLASPPENVRLSIPSETNPTEDLLEGRHDHVDLVLLGDPLELGREARGVVAW